VAHNLEDAFLALTSDDRAAAPAESVVVGDAA
jgi:hypothetical protein